MSCAANKTFHKENGLQNTVDCLIVLSLIHAQLKARIANSQFEKQMCTAV